MPFRHRSSASLNTPWPRRPPSTGWRRWSGNRHRGSRASVPPRRRRWQSCRGQFRQALKRHQVGVQAHGVKKLADGGRAIVSFVPGQQQRRVERAIGVRIRRARRNEHRRQFPPCCLKGGLGGLLAHERAHQARPGDGLRLGLGVGQVVAFVAEVGVAEGEQGTGLAARVPRR